MSRIVLFSQLTSLAEHCRALADGIGLTLEVRAPDSGGWQDAVLVLLGEDVTVRPAISGVESVLVAQSATSTIWTLAARLGTDQVAVLPDAAEWLTQRMIQAVEPTRTPATTYGIMAGCGGAGASVLACALARAGTQDGLSTVLLDADPLGGGLDLLLGCESAEGLRWPALAASRGRLLPSTLVQALPRTDDLAVLSWDRHGVDELAAEVFDTVLAAAQQAFDLVIVDLPRHAPSDWVRACHRVTVVTPARVRAAVAAARVVARLSTVNAAVGLVVRQTGRSGLDPDIVAETLGLNLAGTLRDDPQLAAQVDRGEGLPTGRTNVGKLAACLLDARDEDVATRGGRGPHARDPAYDRARGLARELADAPEAGHGLAGQGPPGHVRDVAQSGAAHPGSARRAEAVPARTNLAAETSLAGRLAGHAIAGRSGVSGERLSGGA